MTSLSPPIQAVVALFRGPLKDVRFADIDAVGLSNLATEAENAASEVEQHEAKLAELRQTLAQRQEALLVLAQQALAYARIYAEGDDTLTAELNDIALPRAAKPRKASALKSRTEDAPGTADAEAQPATALVAAEPAEAARGEGEGEAEPEAAPIARKGRRVSRIAFRDDASRP